MVEDKNNKKEIEHEKKWLITSASFRKLNENLKDTKGKREIMQIYIETEEENKEKRIRRIIPLNHKNPTNKYTKTTKIGSGSSRKELEDVISLNTFLNILTENKMEGFVNKNQHMYRDGKYYLEVEKYIYPEDVPCLVLEIEFESRKDKNEFDLQEQFPYLSVKEVTDDKKFKNRNIAKNGFPSLDYIL
jgi:CYTH domain-containing protein